MNNRLPRLTSWLVLPVLVFSSTLRVVADELTLKNGDRVTGKIVSQTSDAIVIETVYAGKIIINSAHIEKIASETAAANSANGTAVGESTVAAAPVTKPADQKPTVPAPQPVPRLFGGSRFFGLTEGWEGNANIGFSYTSGNSNTTTMSSGIRAVKNGGDDKLTVYARNLWNSNRNSGRQVTTQNAVWGGLRYDRDINDRLFAFGSFDFERDRPKKLNLRSVLGGGIGHHTFKNEKTELELIVGGAWNRTWQVGPNSDTPEALAGNTFKHKLHERLKLQQTFTFFQNFTDRNEYRFIFDATVTADLTKRIGWQFTIGDRFNNDPVNNSKKNDFLFTTGLRWNFGRKK